MHKIIALTLFLAAVVLGFGFWAFWHFYMTPFNEVQVATIEYVGSTELLESIDAAAGFDETQLVEDVDQACDAWKQAIYAHDLNIRLRNCELFAEQLDPGTSVVSKELGAYSRNHEYPLSVLNQFVDQSEVNDVVGEMRAPGLWSFFILVDVEPKTVLKLLVDAVPFDFAFNAYYDAELVMVDFASDASSFQALSLAVTEERALLDHAPIVFSTPQTEAALNEACDNVARRLATAEVNVVEPSCRLWIENDDKAVIVVKTDGKAGEISSYRSPNELERFFASDPAGTLNSDQGSGAIGDFAYYVLVGNDPKTVLEVRVSTPWAFSPL